MNATQIDERGVIVRCESCGKANRIAFRSLGETAQCGSCKTALGQIRTPIEVESDEQFNALINDSALPVLVDFWAPWCGPCKMVAPEFEKVAAMSQGQLIVAKVNTEGLSDLAQRYLISSIPTMVVFAGGREIERTAGARPAATIKTWAERAAAQALAHAG